MQAITFRRLLLASLRFHSKTHWGVFFGAAVATAVLIGALAVGDSVRISLRDKALSRLGGFQLALQSNDRFFGNGLADRLMKATDPQHPKDELFETRLVLPGNISRQDGTARANRIEVHGVAPNDRVAAVLTSNTGAPLEEGVWLSRALAAQLAAKPGDELILRLHKPSALSRDAIVTPRNDASVALRLRYQGVVDSMVGGDISLRSGQAAPLNAFVRMGRLAAATGLGGRANLILGTIPQGKDQSPDAMALSNALARVERTLRSEWDLSDAELTVRPWIQGQDAAPKPPPGIELISRRIFIDPAVLSVATNLPVPGATAAPILTYLVNTISTGNTSVPYSMVTAAGAPWTPEDLADDEIIVNSWLARELLVKAGDTLQLTYFRADSASSLAEQTNRFRIRGIVPMTGVYADRTLMPEFPGLSKAESTHDWDAGFDLVHKVRDQDEAYWKEWRGTPKAFVNARIGRAMWGNRFGNATAVRWRLGADPAIAPIAAETFGKQLLRELEPKAVGLRFEDIQTPALAGAAGGQDFGGLFIGFSFFLIVSALLLTSMLFRFGLEQRAVELGTLLALGWPLRRVMRLYLREGALVACAGSILGTFGGIAYGSGVLWGLNTLWRDAVGGTGLAFHATPPTIVGGIVGSIVIATFSLWMTLRSAAARPARELLNEGVSTRAWKLNTAKHGRLVPVAASVLALGMVAGGWAVPESSRPGIFFGAGAGCLIAGLLWIRLWLRHSLGATRSLALSTTALAKRAPSRNPSRSLSTIALLASATFLIVAVGANKLDASKDAARRSSGTGGFALWGESALPIVQDLNTQKGQEQNGLDPKRLQSMGVHFVSMRVREGDEASCLNLNRALRPRLLGVNPRELSSRGAFTFTGLAKETLVTNGWDALLQPAITSTSDSSIPEIPGIGDANSIQWALHKSLGDTLDYVDEQGRPFRVRLVGAVANSILQGNLFIDEQEFARRFPSESGRKAFLIDIDPAHFNSADQVSAEISKSLQDSGLELVSTSVRLNRFNAVQNTYLNTFQVLGGLGLLLGSIGLGIVVLRNVFDRKGEFALLQAVGFRDAALEQLVMWEHRLLLFLGLGVGTASSVIVLIPALSTPRGGDLPYVSLAVTLLLVLANGLVWTYWATRHSLKQGVLRALRGE